MAALPVIGPWLDSVLPTFLTEGLGVPFYFGARSFLFLLIVVGVAMDTVQRIQSQRTQAKNIVQP